MTLSTPVLALGLAGLAGGVLTAAVSPAFRPARLAVAGGLVAVAVAAFTPSLGAIAAAVLLLAGLQFRATRSLGLLRSAGLAAGLLALATVAAAGPAGARSDRLAALAAALAIAAAAGLVPHLAELDGAPSETTSSAVTAFVMPTVALAIVARMHALLPATSLRVFGGVLLALGCANVVWGLAAALGDDERRAWRGAYLADWGLVLVALGLLSQDGAASAYLLLLALLLLRIPLLFRPGGTLTAAALAGAAPFAGFAGRLLLLRGATAIAWPLALGVGLALLLWLPVTWRQAQLEPPLRGRALVVQLVTLAVMVAAGVYPAGFLRPVGLG